MVASSNLVRPVSITGELAYKVAKQKIDVSGHVLVPKHTKLSQKDKNALFKKYNITLNQLPKILSSDPAIAGMDVKEGDVIKIKRASPTAETATFYRGVVNG